jgi:hypothetical protein
MYVVLALALVLFTGSAQAVTSFYDDFSSGTLDQWTVASPFIAVAGPPPNSSALIAMSSTSAPIMFGNSWLDPGLYELSYVFTADATENSTIVFDVYPTSNPGSFTPDVATWFSSSNFLSVDARTGPCLVNGPLFSSWSMTPFGDTGWRHVTATFTAPDFTFFSMTFASTPGGMMLLDNFSIKPLGGPVPEPTSLALIGCGLAGVAFRAVRRKKV